MTAPVLFGVPAPILLSCNDCGRNVSPAQAVGIYGPSCAKKHGLTPVKKPCPVMQDGPDLFDSLTPEIPDAV